MFDDGIDDKRSDLLCGGPGPLVTRARRVLAVSYALEDRLRATGHLVVGAPDAAHPGRPTPRTPRHARAAFA